MNIDKLVLKLHRHGQIVGISPAVINITNSNIFKTSKYILSYDKNNIYLMQIGIFNKVLNEVKSISINQIESYSLKNFKSDKKIINLYLINDKRIDFNYYSNTNEYQSNRKNINKFIEMLKENKIIRNNNVKDKEHE